MDIRVFTLVVGDVQGLGRLGEKLCHGAREETEQKSEKLKERTRKVEIFDRERGEHGRVTS
jgi:hypothetical protein